MSNGVLFGPSASSRIRTATTAGWVRELILAEQMSLPPVECKFITQNFAREWKSSNANPSSKLPDPVPMLRFVYELCWNMVRGELPFQKCRPILDSVEFLDKPTNQEVGSTFADVVSQMALDLTLTGESRNRLVKSAKWLVESKLVPLRLLQERCEEEFLWEAELIKIKAPELKNKEVRVNTRLLYQQTKFNLIREESEGYAKLVTLLCQGSQASSQSAISATIGIIKSLIGHFDLDPNRVFDIVLECFELQPDSNIFLELIPIFPKSHASQILGFKFQHYQRIEVNTPVPFGLYKLTALLVKEDFIDLDSVCLHLHPKDDEAIENCSSFSAKRLEEANKIGKINLAATGKDLMEDEKQGDVSIDIFSALDMEAEAVTERIPELENNQSLGLLCGFLAVEDWYHANMLFDRLSPLIPVAHLQICDGLFRLIEKTICSAYKVVRQIHARSFGCIPGHNGDLMDSTESLLDKSFVDLPKELFQMLACVGPYLYRDSILLQKVCRVLRGYLVSAHELVSGSNNEANPEFVSGESKPPRLHLKEARLRVEEALGTCVLPSLQLVPANPATGQEIWEVMNLLPYEVRYRLYGEWEKDDEKMPMILAARQIAKLDTRRILKRLAKENLKQLGRMVAKLAHANPLTVLRTILNQIEAYRDMITPVVDAFKYLTQLEYDILEYVVIERLAQGGREKLKDDGLNLSDWLQSLASFWGHLCKKYPSMELRGLFQYLVNQLKRGQGIELVLLQELIQQMANVQYTENLTEEQLDAMSGSETLRYQATSFGMTRNNKALVKSTNRLRDSLLPMDEPKLAVPLLLLIAQHRSVVVINAEAPYIKMVSEQFDRCHGILLQYVEFLCSAVTPASAYAHLIPPLDDLVHLYHLDPEVAFLIYRPVMRLFKYRSSLEVCWPLNDKEAASLTAESEDMSSELVLDLGAPRKPIIWSDLLGIVKTMLPAKAWNSLSPDLYATFWGLTLYDLYVPRTRYESEFSKQYAALKSLEELSDNSSSAITKRKKEKERIQESLDRLTNELNKHEEHVASVRARLTREKDRWLSSCPDTLKINMEFLQRCIFPRCTFSMPDAVYCAMFVNTLHSLGTPFFNTVNHIDVLICKTLQPMICCCTEYEVGRLGRFLYETLKTAYYWKSDESIYERECSNMPGFAVYYRYPNSQRVTYGQFIKVHWKWSQRITKLLIHCLESTEYMEIRNALIMLTKISGVFPVTRKTGINLEKRVAKIKSDEREDLKVLATGVAAALAARKSFWVTDEEFGMGYLELKAAPSLPSKAVAVAAAISGSQSESAGGRVAAAGKQPIDSGNAAKEQTSSRTKYAADGKLETTENSSLAKSDPGSGRVRGGSSVSGSDAQTSTAAAAAQGGGVNQKHGDDSVAHKGFPKPEVKASSKRGGGAAAGSSHKPPKQDTIAKDDGKSGKTVAKTSSTPPVVSDRGATEGGISKQAGGAAAAAANGSYVSAKGGSTPSITTTRTTSDSSHGGGGEAKAAESSSSKSFDVVRGGASTASKDDGSDPSSLSAPPHPKSSSSEGDKINKRSSPSDEVERVNNKRRKGEIDAARGEIEGSGDGRVVVSNNRGERSSMDDRDEHKVASDKVSSKDKGGVVENRHDRDRGEHRLERDEKASRDNRSSMERHGGGRERSVERGSSDRLLSEKGGGKDERERVKDDRSSKLRHESEKPTHGGGDDRFHHGGHGLPPPPPLPPHVVPQSIAAGGGNSSRRDDDAGDRRLSSTRLAQQRLSPRHEERDRRRSEENNIVSQERRRDDEKEREREKTNLAKEDMDTTTTTGSKRRKLSKREQQQTESGEYSPVGPPPPPLSIGLSHSQPYDSRDRGDRKAALAQRSVYLEEPSPRIHGKDVPAKTAHRRDDQMYERELNDEKRQRAEQKRRHRK